MLDGDDTWLKSSSSSLKVSPAREKKLYKYEFVPDSADRRVQICKSCKKELFLVVSETTQLYSNAYRLRDM